MSAPSGTAPKPSSSPAPEQPVPTITSNDKATYMDRIIFYPPLQPPPCFAIPSSKRQAIEPSFGFRMLPVPLGPCDPKCALLESPAANVKNVRPDEEIRRLHAPPIARRLRAHEGCRGRCGRSRAPGRLRQAPL